MRTSYEYSAGVIPFHYQEDFFPLYLVLKQA